MRPRRASPDWASPTELETRTNTTFRSCNPKIKARILYSVNNKISLRMSKKKKSKSSGTVNSHHVYLQPFSL